MEVAGGEGHVRPPRPRLCAIGPVHQGLTKVRAARGGRPRVGVGDNRLSFEGGRLRDGRKRTVMAGAVDRCGMPPED